jgi:hypothetical protein
MAKPVSGRSYLRPGLTRHQSLSLWTEAMDGLKNSFQTPLNGIANKAVTFEPVTIHPEI